MHVTRNNEPHWDDSMQPPRHGFDIRDHQLLDLIGEVEEIFDRERQVRETTPSHLIQGTRTAIEQAAIDITETFWDDEVWIVVYEVDRGYGGPEEGGWYYNTYQKVSQYRIDGDSWATIVPQARAAEQCYREYYQSQEYGQLGSFGDSQHFMVQIEIVPQGWNQEVDEGPGKAERRARPRWS